MTPEQMRAKPERIQARQAEFERRLREVPKTVAPQIAAAKDKAEIEAILEREFKKALSAFYDG